MRCYFYGWLIRIQRDGNFRFLLLGFVVLLLLLAAWAVSTVSGKYRNVIKIPRPGPSEKATHSSLLPLLLPLLLLLLLLLHNSYTTPPRLSLIAIIRPAMARYASLLSYLLLLLFVGVYTSEALAVNPLAALGKSISLLNTVLNHSN